MLKPVSILSLDLPSSTLAEAVQRRVAAAVGLDELVQTANVSGHDIADVTMAIDAIHVRRQAPDSALRLRDDISNRELVLLVLSSSGPARNLLLDLARDVRDLYHNRNIAQYFSIEVLCLLPDLFTATVAADYGAAYSLLKMATAAEPKPFDTFWLLGGTNGNGVKFGKIEQSPDAYVEAIAGMLTHEPELSGALVSHNPRRMYPAFSSFGFAELFFPRDVVVNRMTTRLSAELLREELLSGTTMLSRAVPSLAARQFVAGDSFASPLARIGVEGGHSLFRRFQAKSMVTEKTRNAEEVIAAVRGEVKAHREHAHLHDLETLARQGDQTANDLAGLLDRTVDETLDRDGYGPAIDLLQALLDPLPDLGVDTIAPRNLITEIGVAAAALDARVHFTANTAGSDAARLRVRELDSRMNDQTLVAETLMPLGDGSGAGDGDESSERATVDAAREAAAARAESIAAMKREMTGLTLKLPDLLFAEESENNVARNAARQAEAARLALETEAREQQLRELFAERPRAEQQLRDMLELRRAYIWRQIWIAVMGVGFTYGVPFALGGLLDVPLFRELHAFGVSHLRQVTTAVLIGVALFAIVAILRYLSDIAPRLRAARENLQRIRTQIEVTDRAKNNAHNDELQFEYDVALRRTTLAVLRRTRDIANKTRDALQSRLNEMRQMANAFADASSAAAIDAANLQVSIVDDGDVGRWYERTADDRRLLFLEFEERCVTRAQARHLAVDTLRERIETYAARAFSAVAKMTLEQLLAKSGGLADEETVTQRVKRLAEYSGPLVEIVSDDLEAQRTMQLDTTLWFDGEHEGALSKLRRRLPHAQLKPAVDPLRVQALSRVLHFPGYVLAQLAYYRAQYDPQQHPESAQLPDLMPTELLLTGAVRTAYEQVILGRAVGVIRLRDDGKLGRATDDLVLGDTHFAAAQRLASFASAELRHELDDELAAHLTVAADVERDLRGLLAAVPRGASVERDVIAQLIKRYESF
jgi:hypothetical protein